MKDRNGRLRRSIRVEKKDGTTTTTTVDYRRDGSPDRITTTTWNETTPGGPETPTGRDTVIYDPNKTNVPFETWHEDWHNGAWVRPPQPSPNPRISSGELKIEIAGTGETIGHIANLRITNQTKSNLKLTIPPMILESVSGKTQHYAVPGGDQVSIDPGKTKTVPVDGVCLVRNKPPVAKGVIGDLIINDGGSVAPGSATKIPAENAQTMLRIATATYKAAKQLEKGGALKEIPYSDPKKKQDIVVQWSTWMNPEISKVTGVPPATKEDLKQVVYKQVPGTMTPDKKKKVDEGIDTIFEKVELTSEKAKDLHGPETSAFEEIDLTGNEAKELKAEPDPPRP